MGRQYVIKGELEATNESSMCSIGGYDSEGFQAGTFSRSELAAAVSSLKFEAFQLERAAHRYLGGSLSSPSLLLPGPTKAQQQPHDGDDGAVVAGGAGLNAVRARTPALTPRSRRALMGEG